MVELGNGRFGCWVKKFGCDLIERQWGDIEGVWSSALKNVTRLQRERSRRNSNCKVVGWELGEMGGTVVEMGRKGQMWDVLKDRLREFEQMLDVDSDMEAEMMPASGFCINAFWTGSPTFSFCTGTTNYVDSCGWCHCQDQGHEEGELTGKDWLRC